MALNHSLTLTVKAMIVPPAIVTQPQSITTNQNKSITLSVVAIGSSLGYQWRHNGIDINHATNSTYTIANASGSDSGFYSVVVMARDESSDTVFTVLSQSAQVVVLLKAVVTSTPVFRELVSGTNMALSIDILGPGPIDYVLFRDNVELARCENNTISNYYPRVFTSIRQDPTDLQSFSIQLIIVSLEPSDSGIYTIETSNSGGVSGPTEVASLVVLAPPVITVRPISQIVYADDSFSLSVSVSGTLPMSYQWRRNGTDLSSDIRTLGARSLTLTVRSATNTDNGIYELFATNKAGSVLSPPATVKIITNLAGSWVEYQMSELFNPRRTNLITIKATPPAGTKTYAIEDLAPSGWGGSATNFSASPPTGEPGTEAGNGHYDAGSGIIKYGPFYDDTPRSLSYIITPSSDATDRVLFEVVGSADGSDTHYYKILIPNVPHPADLNPDYELPYFQMDVNEVTAYAAAWLKGASWISAPTNIPANYVTRAGALWKNGSDYVLSPSAGAAPMWWVNTNTVISRVGRMMISGAHSAVRSIDGLNATISIDLAANATVYAVEETIPPGFSATSISDGGTLDMNHNQIKWGPFFDNSPRTLKYILQSPVGFAGSVAVSGIVSIDGNDLDITGDSSFNNTVIVEEAQLELEKFPGLIINGTLGARYRIESSDSLSPAQWIILDTITLTNNPQYWLDGRAPLIQAQRFYRAVIIP